MMSYCFDLINLFNIGCLLRMYVEVCTYALGANVCGDHRITLDVILQELPSLFYDTGSSISIVVTN